jgi:hypothetical protein
MLVQDHKNEDLEESHAASRSAENSGTMCDNRGEKSVKHTKKDVSNSGGQVSGTETTSLSASSFVNAVHASSGNKNSVNGNYCGENTVNAAPTEDGGCSESAVVCECTELQRLVEENQECSGSPQQETDMTEENQTILFSSPVNEQVTTPAVNRKDADTNGGSDTDKESEELQYAEEIPKPRNLQHRAFVSPKIRQLQELLGFVSQSETARNETDSQDNIKPLNPFDKRAAEETRKLGLLKSPLNKSHFPAFHIG